MVENSLYKVAYIVKKTSKVKRAVSEGGEVRDSPLRGYKVAYIVKKLPKSRGQSQRGGRDTAL